MRSKIVLGAVGLMLAGTTLTACGSGDSTSSDSSGDYCSELKSDKAFFATLDGSDPDLSNLDEVFTRMHTLADKRRPPSPTTGRPWTTPSPRSRTR